MNRVLKEISKILEREGVRFEFLTSPPFPSYKGSYILVVFLNKNKRIKIGKLGEFLFKKGFYFYVGSAKGGIDKRVNRYFNLKRAKWHIDYLLREGKSVGVFCVRNKEEEELSHILRKYREEPIKGFGSSDKSCFSHLFV